MKYPQEIEREPFENDLIDRDLDDLWFRIEHYYHEYSPEKENNFDLSNLKQKTKSNKKNNQPKNEEKEETFDIMDYIMKHKKKEETIESIPRKSKLFIKKEIQVQIPEKKPFLKRKTQLTQEISLKKILKEQDFEKKPQKFVTINLKNQELPKYHYQKLPRDYSQKDNLQKEIHLRKDHSQNTKDYLQMDYLKQNHLQLASQKDHSQKENSEHDHLEKNHSEKKNLHKDFPPKDHFQMNLSQKNLNKSRIEHNKSTSTHYQNDQKKIVKNLRSSRSIPKSVGHLLEMSTISMNHIGTHTNNVSYVPALHGTREIRKAKFF